MYDVWSNNGAEVLKKKFFLTGVVTSCTITIAK